MAPLAFYCTRSIQALQSEPTLKRQRILKTCGKVNIEEHSIVRDAHRGGFGTARRCLQQLALAAVLLVPAAVRAQSTDLLLAYKNFEAAKAADKVSDALKFGNAALKLTEAGGDKQDFTELLLNLGDYAAQANQDGPAVEYYGRALALQESSGGAKSPD